MESQPRAVILECDGVLVDTEAATRRAWRTLTDEWLRDEPPSEEAIRALSGRRPTDALPGFLREWFPYRHTDEAMRARAEHYYRAVREERLSRFPDATQVIEQLRERRLPYGCVSANPLDQLLFELQQAGLLEEIPVCVGGDEVPTGPPAPDLLREAAIRLATPTSACLLVAATPVGIQSAHAARMPVIAVATIWSVADLADAHAVLGSLSDLLSAFDGIG